MKCSKQLSVTMPWGEHKLLNGSDVKSTLVIFSDCERIVHQEFVPPGQTVNQHHHLEVWKRLREQVRRNRPERWQNQDWLLHSDNAPAHTALSVRRFLTAKNMPVAPTFFCDFLLFPRMKSKLKGLCFQDVTEVQGKSLITDRPSRFSRTQRCAIENWQWMRSP
jgi:hypothetical protein